MSMLLADPGFLRRLDDAVADLLSDAGCTGPPVDAEWLAREHFRLHVCVDRRQPGRGRVQNLLGRAGQICLRAEDRPERRQWTVAHELAEHRRAWLRTACGLAPGELSPGTAEELANQFAQRLLVPTDWLRSALRDGEPDLLQLKKQFATASHEVIAFRLLDLGEPSIVTVLDHGHVTRRRGRPWPAPRWLLPAEQECQRRVHLGSRPARLEGMGYVVDGWPIHELGWKREILRTVLAEG
ncbi:MAG TPA: ImmA/IrrE family metallo-endopeptidase [Gemmatales bacterium]|nr:ImmA/IrrE family metallo-endopeptidase [Gemmatales bacterium]